MRDAKWALLACRRAAPEQDRVSCCDILVAPIAEVCGAETEEGGDVAAVATLPVDVLGAMFVTDGFASSELCELAVFAAKLTTAFLLRLS